MLTLCYVEGFGITVKNKSAFLTLSIQKNPDDLIRTCTHFTVFLNEGGGGQWTLSTSYFFKFWSKCRKN